jgi:hypothetical protein
MIDQITAQKEILKVVIKKIIMRIKEVEQESNDAYTQEDVWIKEGIKNELISWKINLEIMRKNIK